MDVQSITFEATILLDDYLKLSVVHSGGKRASTGIVAEAKVPRLSIGPARNDHQPLCETARLRVSLLSQR